jgi:protein-tyrosine sulfotransferase
VLLQLGDPGQAEMCFDAAIDQRPEQEDALLGLAEAAIWSQQLPAARSIVEPLLPAEHPDAWALMGCIHHAEGRYAEAAAVASEALLRADGEWLSPHRLEFLDWLEAARADEPAYIFIGGAGRSGTTLLRAMLHAHPRIHCGPEAKVVPMVAAMRQQWVETQAPSLADAGIGPDLLDRGIKALLQTLLDGITPDGCRVAEKTPHNVLHIDYLGHLFPRAKFIHVIRDGRAVAASLIKQPWVMPGTSERVAYCQDLTAASMYWVDVVSRARQVSSSMLGRVLEVRYEELVSNPETVMRRVLVFLGEPWDESVLHHHDADLVLPYRESSSEAVAHPIHGGCRPETDAAIHSIHQLACASA